MSENALPPEMVVPTAVAVVPNTPSPWLRRVGEWTQSLSQAPGPKALFRRFGEILAEHFAVTSFDVLRLADSPTGPRLKRRAVGCRAAVVLPDEVLGALSQVLMPGGLLPKDSPLDAELGDGSVDVVAAGLPLTVALIEDPQVKGGTIVAWQRAPEVERDPDARHAQDLMVRLLQNEARWLCKLDRTQAMLYRDDLTGLFNHRYLELALDGELRRAERFGSKFCLLFIDLDGFKPINDTYGHLAGSAVLRQVAQVILSAVREVDLAMRYGGDEFVVMLIGATCAAAMLAAERVRRLIEVAEFKLAPVSGTARLTASIGVAAYPEHGRDRQALLRTADETMYQSKRTGKNRVTVALRGVDDASR